MHHVSRPMVAFGITIKYKFKVNKVILPSIVSIRIPLSNITVLFQVLYYYGIFTPIVVY